MSFNNKEIEILTKSSTDFTFFVNNIFCLSEKNFIGGEYVDFVSNMISKNKKTIRVSARNHFKSFAFYAHFMWKLMFEGSVNDLEGHYFSYNADLASYHISKIKKCISANPYFKDIIDGKTTAESVLKYSWDGKHWTTMHPHGLVQFKRGIHCDLTYVDDPFQDPENELNQSIIFKINEIFKSNILDMPKEPDGELHCAGTPQTNNDFFFDQSITKRFEVSILPAIQKNEITGEEFALWPEWMDLKELYEKREERTARIFSKEYLCTPVYSTKGFFDKDTLKNKIVNNDLVLYNAHKKYVISNDVIAGFDIGKKTHPSHLSVFERRDNKLVMIHEKWMDGWNYSNGKEYYDYSPTQIEYIKMCIKNFNIRELRYDNTRGEFESLDEQGLLPRQMTPVVFSSKLKSSCSVSFDKLVERSQLEIPNNDRLINQICAVMSDLQAIQSTEGHGDAFWSIALAISCAPDLAGFYTDEVQSRNRYEIKTGSRSIFEDGMRVPKGW